MELHSLQTAQHHQLPSSLEPSPQDEEKKHNEWSQGVWWRDKVLLHQAPMLAAWQQARRNNYSWCLGKKQAKHVDFKWRRHSNLKEEKHTMASRGTCTCSGGIETWHANIGKQEVGARVCENAARLQSEMASACSATIQAHSSSRPKASCHETSEESRKKGRDKRTCVNSTKRTEVAKKSLQVTRFIQLILCRQARKNP